MMRKESNQSLGLRYELVKIGRDKTPCIILDDYTSALDWLKREAKKVSFEDVVNKSYPGVRSDLPAGYTETTVEHLRKVITSVYSVPDDYEISGYSGYFSMITKTGSELSVGQRMPHFDTAEPYYFAILQYLNDAPHGGTGFFRHKPSGIERVSSDCADVFVRRAKQYMAGNGPPAERYCLGDDHFELVEKVDYVRNRLIVYPGNVLHSALVDEVRDVGLDPESGRLTANIFVGFDKC